MQIFEKLTNNSDSYSIRDTSSDDSETNNSHVYRPILNNCNTRKVDKTGIENENSETLKPVKSEAMNHNYKMFMNTLKKFKDKEITLNCLFDSLERCINYKKMSSQQLHQCRFAFKNELFNLCNNEKLKELYKKIDLNLKRFYWKAVNREKVTYILNELNITIS